MQPLQHTPAAPSSSRPHDTSARAQQIKLVCALSLTAALLWGWYLYTGQIWEDFFITLRHSQNAALGHGLVFTPGERVHGFTSPLNVLLPTVILALHTSFTPEAVLAIYNIVATILLLAASIPFYRYLIARDTGLRPMSWLFLPLLVGLNVKICSFAMNGQEAAFTLAFLGLALVALWRDEPSTWKLVGFSWGGLMWTRPDSPVLIVALGLAALAFTAQPRKQVLLGLIKSAALCAVLYLPWFVGTTWYYGSPIPHTILAKQLYHTAEGISVGSWVLRLVQAFWTIVPRQFTPPYAECGGWPHGYHLACAILTLAACTYWLVPGKDRIGKSASLVCLVWLVYQAYVEATVRAFPWYFPAGGFAGAIVILRILQRFADVGRKAAMTSLVVGAMIVGLSAYGYVASLRPIKMRQIYIEDGVRRQVGLWLKDNVRTGEHVYLEPIGYIGYFSGCALYDYPGLVSPLVVKTLRETHANFYSCIEQLNPEWLVLRSGEAEVFEAKSPVANRYELVRAFTPVEEFIQIKDIDATYALQSDLIFEVYHRRY
jgi:hypothetical protein